MSVSEISIQIKNAPGQLAQITAVLAEAGVNIKGITASSAGKVGWVRLVVDKPKLAEEALDECGFDVESGEAVGVIIADEPGALDRALRALVDEKINVDYVYTCVEHHHGKILAILGVQSPSKAEKLLKQAGLQTVVA
ncbi:MAG: ACT domain-containing protein [Candidatus Sumerlaeaceae bacterium]|nr:ACT domain-containing protein [Candidatus Sumerlaeaceae bacterium]